MKEYDEIYEVCPHCGFVDGTPPRELYHLHPGEILHGRYIVGTVVGYGGFGVIYRVWDAQMEQVAAIKEYFPSGLVNRTPGRKEVIVYAGKSQGYFAAGLERYLLEARNMAAFSHPNIVSVYDFFEENNTAYIVMELLEGISLKTYLSQNGGKISCEEMLEIMMPIMEALENMHQHQIIHRDVSPDNIFLCTGQRIKLIDFGAARFADSRKEETRSIVLKPGYAPPEQYRGKSRQGSFTDVYAVGACMYRAVTGVMPEESLSRMMEDNMQEPREREPEIPERLNAIIMKAMALSPEDRFQTMREMMEAIEGKRSVVPPEEEIKRRKHRRRLLFAAGLVLVLGLGVAGYFGVINHTRLLRVNYSGDVNFYVPESKLAYYENIEEDFEKDNPSEDITLVAVADDSYKETVLEKVGKKDGATLFFSDNFTEEEMEAAEDLQKPVIENLEDLEENYYFLSAYYEEDSSRYTRLPLNFTVPLIVENTTVGQQLVASVTSVDDLLLKESKQNKTVYKVKTSMVSLVEAFGVDAEQTISSQKGIKKMRNNNMGYYITDWADYKAMITDSTSTRMDILYPADSVSLDAQMCNYLSVADDANIQAKMVAEDFAMYIINSQNAYLSDFTENVLPVQKDAVETFSNIWILSLESSVGEGDGKEQFENYLSHCHPVD